MKIQFEIIIALLSISAVFAGLDNEPECTTPEPKKVCTGGPNDEWSNCGSACPLTCEKPEPGICTKQCILNTCQCQNNTVRAKDGQCIKASDCSWYEKKENTTENEKCTAKCTGGVDDKCTLCGTACPLTCDKPKVDICTLQCKVNVCECRNDTVRDTKTGQCVKPDQCPKPKANCTGGPHDKYTNCGSSCPLTCDKPTRGVCLAVCVPNTCECESPYVRDTKTGQCVKLDQCPPPKANCTGGPHDKYTDCGSPCPSTCDEPEGGVCATVCVPNTCKCESPYVRDTKSGQCVKVDQCPPKNNGTDCPTKCTGGPHDKCVKDCGNMCPPTCANPSTTGKCNGMCRPNVCRCEDGWVRDLDGTCIKPEQCPSNTTTTAEPCETTTTSTTSTTSTTATPCTAKCTGGPHDHCKSCGTICPATCKTPYPQACAEVCVKDVCQCDDGWVRDLDGTCIKPEQCPNNTTTTAEPCETSTTITTSTTSTTATPCTAKCTGGPYDQCTLCGSLCPASCANPKPRFCSLRCAKNVCRCKPGTLRDSNGKCVKADKCPKDDDDC